ncbi:MAG TPA: ATP-binding protein [Sphingomicrobium sp.]|nr:ATP-binding protein [Sphingomicrobium sp.]
MSISALPISLRRDGPAIAAALDEIHVRLADIAGCKAPEPMDPAHVPAPLILELARRLALSDSERQAILFAASAELCATTSALVGRIGSGPPTVGLTMRCCEGLDWQSFRPDGALRRARLLNLGGADHARFTERPVAVEEAVLHFLNGVVQIAPELVAVAAPASSTHPVPTDEGTLETIASLLRLRKSPFGTAPIEIDSEDVREGVCHAVEGLRRAGFGAMIIATGVLPPSATELAMLRDCWLRDSLLHGLGLVIVGDGDHSHAAVQQVCGWSGPVVLVGVPARPSIIETHRITIRHDGALRLHAWTAALSPERCDRHAALLEHLASRFRLSTPTIAAIAAEHGDSDPQDLWNAARVAARPRALDLIERIEPVVTLDQVILPDDAKEALVTMVSAARVHHRILADWKETSAGGRGLGIAALFSGESGTGKTMAAEAVAREIGVDLYRVEVSTVVSKYIGETEKNLRRIFAAAEAGGGVLLFDEAEALFGKRSEVRDAHDRYANMEVGYLLQLMEGFSGLAILTTNFGDALDEAFTRRLRFCVSFPMPGANERKRIWSGAFPPNLDVRDVNVERLAGLPVSGGVIRNIALGAAFRAAAAGQASAVSMNQVLEAARAEYLKLGRPLTEIDSRRWS